MVVGFDKLLKYLTLSTDDIIQRHRQTQYNLVVENFHSQKYKKLKLLQSSSQS